MRLSFANIFFKFSAFCYDWLFLNYIFRLAENAERTNAAPGKRYDHMTMDIESTNESIQLNLRVKICGITQLADAHKAVALGADALGFIFYENSPRNTSPAAAAEIIRRLPPEVHKVGVFVKPDPQWVAAVAEVAGLTAIQLHRITHSRELIRLPNVKTILAVSVGQENFIDSIHSFADAVDLFLLDTYHPHLPGGTGQTFDWSIAAKVSQTIPIVLAGGLTPENVRRAVEQVQPFAVDVSSGIERQPGIKDHQKMIRFFKQIEDFRYEKSRRTTSFFPISG